VWLWVAVCGSGRHRAVPGRDQHPAVRRPRNVKVPAAPVECLGGCGVALCGSGWLCVWLWVAVGVIVLLWVSLCGCGWLCVALGCTVRFRGEINILLCGDPGTSKSQLLQLSAAIVWQWLMLCGTRVALEMAVVWLVEIVAVVWLC
jgi:hypothetical protein